MMMLDSVATGLLGLLRYALWSKNEICLAGGFLEGVMQKAKEQTVFGLAFQALEGTGEKVPDIPSPLIVGWLSTSLQIKRQNEYVNKELEVFARWMTRENIHYRVVKGQVAATCYPDPSVRQCGDIDFWVAPNDLERCEKLIEKELNVTLQRKESEKHVEYQWHGLQYELHSHLAVFAVKKHQQYFEALEREDKGMLVRIGETDVATLSPTFNALYVFVHLFHHLIHGGIGLRQLCDWMMWLHQYKGQIDRAELANNLKKLHLTRPYRVLGAILVDILGLPEEEFPLAIFPHDRVRSRYVLADILKMGNFGHNRKKVSRLGMIHSIQTGLQMCRQSIKHFDLAPIEISLRVPHMIMWYFEK